MKKLIYLLVPVLLTTACAGKKQQTAQVIQRRDIGNGKLMISYRFHTGEKWVYDSTELDNRVIPHDSVMVTFDPGNPGENTLQIP